MNLLEREETLARLGALCDAAAAGRGVLAFVAGEAGVGKTALLECLRERAAPRMAVWWGRCDPLDTPEPLAPLADMRAQMPASLRARLQDGAAPRIGLFAAFLDAIAARPALVVFEDVHWADDATRDLLRYLGRRLARTPVLVVATHRDDELGAGHPLRVVLGDLATAGVQRLAVAPLSGPAVAALAATKGVAAGEAAELHRACGGNPFLVTEVLAAGGRGVPATVRDAALARSARLADSPRGVLDAAAVLGVRADAALLTRLTGAEAHCIDECVGAGVMQREDGEVSFRHALIRDALLDAMAPARRAALHRLALDALVAPGAAAAGAARLAHHAEGAGDADAVRRFAPVAAAEARRAGAHREAAAQIERALRFTGADARPRERAALLESLAVERQALGGLDAALRARQEAIDLWRGLGETARVGANLACQAPMLVNAGRSTEGEARSREALELLEPLPAGRELAQALRVQAHLRMLARDHGPAVAFGERAIALAAALGDLDTLALAENATGTTLMFGDAERGSRLLRHSHELALGLGNDAAALGALTNLGSACGELHRFAEAEGALREAVAHAEPRELDCSYDLAWLALCRLRLGAWDEAAALAERARAMNPERGIGMAMAWLATGRVRARRGDPGAWDALDAALGYARATGHLQRLAPVHAARAEAAWLDGDDARARVEAQAVLDAAREHPWLAGELQFWHWRAGGPAVAGGAATTPYALQVAGDWRAAADDWAARGCPCERAGALADGDDAAQRDALTIFDRLGARPAAHRLRAAMRAQGRRAIPRGPRAATRNNARGLTAREHEILRLLAAGLTNAQIGARRHVSVRTVDHHVAAVLAKLEVATRGDAVRAAREQGLLDAPI